MKSSRAETGSVRSGLAGFLLRGVLPLGVLALGWIGYSILSVEPDEEKRPESKPRVIKTRVTELGVQDFETTVTTRGVVRPHNEVTLTPQVAGRITHILPEFEDGAFFAAGDVLVELDSRDLDRKSVV